MRHGRRKIPPQVPITGRAMPQPEQRGSDPDKPIVCGEPNDDIPRLVEATAMIHGIRKGQQRWVTGTEVAAAVDTGMFVHLADAPQLDLTEAVEAPDPAGRIRYVIRLCPACSGTWRDPIDEHDCRCEPVNWHGWMELRTDYLDVGNDDA